MPEGRAGQTRPGSLKAAARTSVRERPCVAGHQQHTHAGSLPDLLNTSSKSEAATRSATIGSTTEQLQTSSAPEHMSSPAGRLMRAHCGPPHAGAPGPFPCQRGPRSCQTAQCGQFSAASHRRGAMATERLHAAQERLTELLNSRDACIAFAAGSVLGSASAALAALWLQRRTHARRQLAAAAAPLCKASGLRAVLDIDERLAVGAPPASDKGSDTGPQTSTSSAQ